jgi:hypothetical protein
VAATGGNHRQNDWRQTRQKQAKSVATGCHRLPEPFHGKQGVYRGLPPVAGGPLPEKEGVDSLAWPKLFLTTAIRAGALVAAAAGARLSNHARILFPSRPL